jgi:gamma-glutamylcyclotransferase (GGCT)/AIG2-like uncharacterized protein YtfP
MVPSVAEAVLGRRPLSLPATLDGYARFRVWGEDFPGVIPCADHSTTGVLYTGLRADELSVLDRFEGVWYARKRVVVGTVDARRVSAYVYAIRPEYRAILTQESWDAVRFAREKARAFVRAYAGFRRLRLDAQPDSIRS